MSGYLVTGGCGFIGSHLVDSLINDGYYVRILDDLSSGKRQNVSSQCEVIIGDVADVERVKGCMKGMDGCFHLAAVTSMQASDDNWLKAHETNLTGTVNVFEASKKKSTPVVYASSAAVYGDNAEMPLKESARLRPLTAYGADKLASELHAQVVSLVHNVPTTGLRLFNVYGPRQNPFSAYSGVISVFVERILKQQPLFIYGDGQQARDFISVADTVLFFRAAMRCINRAPNVFNVCTGNLLTINQLTRMLMSITGVSVPVEHHGSRKGDIRESVGDPAHAKHILSLTARQSILQGLQELVEVSKSEGLMNLNLINNSACRFEQRL